jgi:hypothetical protein
VDAEGDAHEPNEQNLRQRIRHQTATRGSGTSSFAISINVLCSGFMKSSLAGLLELPSNHSGFNVPLRIDDVALLNLFAFSTDLIKKLIRFSHYVMSL